MKIDFANLNIQYQKLKVQIDNNIKSVLDSSNFIMGEEIQKLEKKLEQFSGAKNAITCSSGTDALTLAMMALDIQPDDEVITSPFTFISSAETISMIKAKPVFVDIEFDTFNIDISKIEKAITKKTKAIIPISLFGQPCDLDEIKLIADKYNLKIIIDGAQSFGSTYKDKTDSCYGDISITSFFPAKPLGCYGDGGALFTNNDNLADKIKAFRVHGQVKKYIHKYIGMGARLDTIQAAILLAKLEKFQDEIKSRQFLAHQYTDTLKDILTTPVVRNDRSSTWAQYTLRVKNRNSFQNFLKERNIPSSIYYPLPLHLQECFKFLGYRKGDFPISENASKEVISLPMNAYFADEEVEYIVNNIKKYIKVNK